MRAGFVARCCCSFVSRDAALAPRPGEKCGPINWNRKPLSLRFFAGRGHIQIVSHVDPAGIVDVLRRSAPECPGIVGVMYTTWSNDFRNLEKYAQAARAFERDYRAAAGKAEPR